MASTTTAASSPGGSPGGGGLGGTLKSKWGPLPVWGWLAAITGVLLAWWLYEQHKNPSAASTTATPNPADAGQPGVVVINQDDAGETPTAPAPPPTTPPKAPEKKPNGTTRGITLTQNETLAELAKQRHWTPETLRRVEQMNVTQGGGTLDPNTKLKKGQTILRPIKGTGG
jgi:hypothetical protein